MDGSRSVQGRNATTAPMVKVMDEAVAQAVNVLQQAQRILAHFRTVPQDVRTIGTDDPTGTRPNTLTENLDKLLTLMGSTNATLGELETIIKG